MERALPPVHRAGGAPPCWGRYFVSGRSALAWLCATRLPPGARVLCPALICPAVPQAIAAAGAQVVFYPLDGQLQPRLQGTGGDALLVVHFFGRTVQATHPLLIEDRSHTLLNEGQAGAGGLAFASLRKLLPVPDGGVVVGVGGTATGGPLSAIAIQRLVAEALWNAGLVPAAERMASGAEDALDAEIPQGRISQVSLDVLGSLDLTALREARRERYRRIAAAMKAVPGVRLLWDALPDGVAPLAVPLLCRNRHDLRRALYAEGVHAMPFWPVLPEARAAAGIEGRLLAASVLLVPCDPFTRSDDIQRALDSVRVRNP